MSLKVTVFRTLPAQGDPLSELLFNVITDFI